MLQRHIKILELLRSRRFRLFGPRTAGLENRVLMIEFTLRSELVRIITARPAAKKEGEVYLPTELLNELKALGSEQDVPYHALIKLFLRRAVDKTKKKRSA